MSKVGKHPVLLPKNVTISLKDQVMVIKGTAGQQVLRIPEVIQVVLEKEQLTLIPRDHTKSTRALWGTFRSLINHKIEGFLRPFERSIDLVGVGYKASIQGKILTMQLGYSHDVTYVLPDDVEVRCDKPTQMLVSSSNKESLGSVVSQLVAFRPPEPYKGKGLLISGKPVFRKEGKKK